MKATILALMAFFTLSAHAQRYSIVKCQVKSPCKYSQKNNLGFCIGSADIRFNDGRDGSHMVISQQNTDGFEIFRIAADIPVTINQATNIAGQTQDGEDWFAMKIVNGVATGKVTIDQDFQFNIVCK
jgi:hypothetical protein